MINDIAPHCFDVKFSDRLPQPGDYVLSYSGGTVLLMGEENFALPTFADVGGVIDDCEHLFEIDGVGFYLVPGLAEVGVPGCSAQAIGVLRDMQPQHLAFAGLTGGQLYRWRSARRFCGRCGTQTERGSTERSVVCPQCGLVEYPKISPAVIVAVSDGDKLLMARNAAGTYKRYGLIAGFVEVGESFEDTVRREVMEEVGLKLKNIRYYKSQPWAFSDSEMIGFFADLDGAPDITLQRSELAEAVWFDKDEIPPTVSTVSIASELIDMVRTGKHRQI
ncbi:MAG TPA: NAD(+) diphosphatase [Candidatus Acidoferrum sp.]|nr:NAD(+) diphosphatase [Candidatus Acidoferrum sp.]